MTKEIHLESAQILRLQSGDVIVLRMPHAMLAEQRQQLQADFGRLFPSYKAVILEAGAELFVMREGDDAP